MAEKESDKKFFPLFSKKYIPYDQSRAVDLKLKKRKQVLNKTLDNQHRIDAGQTLLKIKQCLECGLVYNICDPENERYHSRYHSRTKNIKFLGWKNEKVVFQHASTSSRIIVIDSKDSNAHWKKIAHIIEVVDRDLGLSEKDLSFYRNKKIYLYIRDKMILGVLVSEPVDSAHRMISDSHSCSTESTSVTCGIHFVWTIQSHRRQGIATALVNALRGTYLEDSMLSVDDIAFSTPTFDGKAFAENYCKTRNFKVYI